MRGTSRFTYASLGSQLEVFELDPLSGDLTPIQSIRLDEVIQYAWPNRARTLLYVACSGSGPMATTKVPNHFVQVFRICADGRLSAGAAPRRLGNRPLFVSLDPDETHLLVAYNDPPDVTVHRLDADGLIDSDVAQAPFALGTTVHQVRVTPYGNIAVVPACAHDPKGGPAGCVDLLDYDMGKLTPRGRIIADPMRAEKWQGIKNGAQGFSARHVDFHPIMPWMFLLVETQGELRLYHCNEAEIEREPRFIKNTLLGAPVGRSSQLASAIHVHPSGRYVYVSNRARDTEPEGGIEAFVGGANTIAVFELDPASGEPTLIHQVDTDGIFPRTFGIDGTGEMLVVGNQEPGMIRDGDTMRRVLPSLVVFQIGLDGRLSRRHRHDLADNGEICFWTTTLSLAPDQTRPT